MSGEEIKDTLLILEDTDISRIELAENVDLRTYQLAVNNLLKLYTKEKEKNIKAIEMLQKHIKHCEQEAKDSLNNEICHIALKFDKHLLQELLEEE